MQFISSRHENLIKQIKKLLLDFLSFPGSEGNNEETLIRDLLFQLEDLFLIVVAGEYNSGKSALINALLGNEYLNTGITPTTSDITILRYGEKEDTQKISSGLTIMHLPAPLLESVSIVDTPGTNAIQREHEALTTEYIPRSDMVIFITSVDRPFTESERKFLETIRNWGKKIAILINKVDIVESDKDLNEVMNFVQENAKKLLGIEPKIFFISAREALNKKLVSGKSDPFLFEIERFIEDTLNPREQIPIKLSNPLSVLNNLTEQRFESSVQKIELLKNDIQLINDIEKQIVLFREDMNRNFKFRYSEIDNILLEYEKRGLEFFDSTFRIARVMDLLNKEKIQNEYNQHVVKGLSQDIDRKVEGLIDWLVEEDLRQWQVITSKIDNRIHKYQNRILDDPDARQIHFERQKIINSVRRESQRIVELFDKGEEAKKIAEDAQIAVTASAAIEVGALGLGALVTLLATTASADLTGVLLAGLTAALGFLIIPAKKKQVRSIFSKNISDLRNKLADSLSEEFSRQVAQVSNRINETIQPYSRFIRSEHLTFENNLTRYKEFKDQIEILKHDISQL